jgi:phosphoglycerate dehydrogenase-like enzyme
MGMMLCHSRGLGTAIRIQKNHPWPRGYLCSRMRRFEGSHVTIVGFGAIGNEIGRKASLLGAHVTGIKRSPADSPSWFRKHDRILVSGSDWRKVLPETDHLVLCLPFDEDTKKSIDLGVFASLPQHAAVYNVGRGHCINENDLITALDEGLIEAAYLDVFSQEPLPFSSGLRSLDNCFIFPHTSALSPDYLDLFIHELKEKLG